ncbi:MAG TPA: type II toxin-antitoxin system Phd/YefM family antitoxin [Candidatus Binataceae bacterium]|nr:type II toxin-antitoxin system Phd/YefM family antitoxin [Candidatus Binataceae bacterium]
MTLEPRRERLNIKGLRTMTAAGARSQFSEIVNRTAFGGERVVVTRRGKPLAALVPIEDLALLEELEDSADARDFSVARKAARREGTVPWHELKRRFGL